MFTIQLNNFFHRHVDHKILQAVGSISQEGFPLRSIKTRHKIKHSKMKEKHLIKTVTHSWRVSTKIKKQSKQEPSKLPTKREGRHFLAIPHKVDSGLPALVVAICSKSSKCSDTNRMLSERS